MTIKNHSEIQHLVDIGTEKGYLTPDEINDYLPQNIFSPEDIEDIFDFLTESNIDIVDTIKEKADAAPEEESPEWGEAERFPSERTDNIIWAYLKDIGRVSLLNSEEEYNIAKTDRRWRTYYPESAFRSSPRDTGINGNRLSP